MEDITMNARHTKSAPTARAHHRPPTGQSQWCENISRQGRSRWTWSRSGSGRVAPSFQQAAWFDR
jgi:hypothetical protein